MDTTDVNDFISDLEEQIKSGVYFLVDDSIIFCKNVEITYDNKYGLIIKTIPVPDDIVLCMFKLSIASKDVKWSTNEDVLFNRLYELRSFKRILNNQN